MPTQGILYCICFKHCLPSEIGQPSTSGKHAILLLNLGVVASNPARQWSLFPQGPRFWGDEGKGIYGKFFLPTSSSSLLTFGKRLKHMAITCYQTTLKILSDRNLPSSPYCLSRVLLTPQQCQRLSTLLSMGISMQQVYIWPGNAFWVFARAWFFPWSFSSWSNGISILLIAQAPNLGVMPYYFICGKIPFTLPSKCIQHLTASHHLYLTPIQATLSLTGLLQWALWPPCSPWPSWGLFLKLQPPWPCL